MSKKKGLSMEEKVQRVEEWFVAHPSPYTMKELLSAVPKPTGVIPQSIEECLEILVSEDRVRQKKIGVHVLYWRFPKTAAQQLAATFRGRSGGAAEAARYLRMTAAQLRAEVAALAEKEAAAAAQLRAARNEWGDAAAAERDARRLRELERERKALDAQLAQAALLRPEMRARIAAATATAIDAANRWTNNIFLIEQQIEQRVGVAPRELRAQLQLPSAIDYVDAEEAETKEEEEEETECALVTAASLSAQAKEEREKEKSASREGEEENEEEDEKEKSASPDREEEREEEKSASPEGEEEREKEKSASPDAAGEREKEKGKGTSPAAATVSNGRKRKKCADDKVDEPPEKKAKSAPASRRGRQKKGA